MPGREPLGTGAVFKVVNHPLTMMGVINSAFRVARIYIREANRAVSSRSQARAGIGDGLSIPVRQLTPSEL